MSAIFTCDMCKNVIPDKDDRGTLTMRGSNPKVKVTKTARGIRYRGNRHISHSLDLCPWCTLALHQAIDAFVNPTMH